MFVDRRFVLSLLFVAGTVLVNCAPTSSFAEDNYESSVRKRATDAGLNSDVSRMIECVFALYPLESKKPVEERIYPKLLNKAADLTIKSNEQIQAAQFLDMCGPLASEINDEKRSLIERIASGKTLDESVKDAAEKSRRPIIAVGADLVDPKVKTRGDAVEEIARAIGQATIVVVRPSTLTNSSDYKTKFLSHSISFPRKNRATLRVKMRFYGAWTQNPYDATVDYKLWLDGDSLEIYDIVYMDNCPVPVDTRLLELLKEKVNEAVN